MSKTKLEEAMQLCASLREARDKDHCMEVIAAATNQSVACGQITSVSKRDACYMNFAMAGDFSVCENVENAHLKKSCELLKYINSSETG